MREGQESGPTPGSGWAGSPVAPTGLLRMLLGALTVLVMASASEAFDFDDVTEKAKKLAQESFEDPRGKVPDWLLEMSYDQWREIRFRPDRALWADRNLPFAVQFFHPGLYYDRPVAVNAVDAEGVHPVEFSPSQFDFGKSDVSSRVPQDLGYAGFRVHYPIKTKSYRDEVIVFLGASYFRAVGKDQGFGVSARGLAIDTASPSGEEFPYFKEFWLVRPSRAAKDAVVYALLDSPSLTGAYRFVITPGTQTIVKVDARLFRRTDVKKLGVAPLTSMFFFGENTTRQFDDFRPEVHDSDGLLLAMDTGEWLWRPIDNPTTLQVNEFKMKNPRGYGLIQRDRDFEHYQDLETRRDQRPSVWVAPQGDWGEGRIELIEIPTQADTNDNVVTFWVPAKLPPREKPIEFSYSLSWYGSDPARPPAGYVTDTRVDRQGPDEAFRVVVDFRGKKLDALPADTVLRGVVTVAGGNEVADIVEQHVMKNPVNGGWRLVFQVLPKGDDPVELRAFLDLGGKTLTETWSYALRP